MSGAYSPKPCLSTISGFIVLCLAIAFAAAPARAYYHFIHYQNDLNLPEKFDLSALPNKTITFFVSEDAPQVLTQTDTFNSVLSQIRQAAAAWNGVASSDLRVAFGGLENGATPQNTPGADVVFEELPPGVYGYGGPTSTANPSAAADGSAFVPIVRSTVHLSRNLTLAPGPSYNEAFFMTTVHEIGHALGLQHTFTSSTMSQATTRATTLSRPIDDDDIAGLSVLYPSAKLAQLGSISGRVTAAGRGVHLASVVALRVGAGALSAMTGTDGAYRIDGVPTGQYYVYVHSIPPDADIQGPWNPDGSVAPASGPVNSLFFPGTTNFGQALPVSVEGGRTTGGINILTAARPAVSLYDGGVYAYFNNNTIAIKPAAVNMFGGLTTVVASGVGLGANGQSFGLKVQLIGGSLTILPNGIRPYEANGYTYVALDLGFSLGAQAGAEHLIFSTPDYMYVLPSGINVTQKPPPTITGASSNGDGTVTLTGTNWASDTLLYFDGLPSSIVSLDAKAGTAIVKPPPGASNQQATLTAYNTDGQNSQFVQAAAPVTWTYGSAPAPLILSISPSSLPAGAEASVDITAAGAAFSPGLTTVGFGTSDIAVRRVFILSPNHLQADVAVSPNAALSNPDVSIISGFQLAVAPGSLQILPQAPGLPAPVPILQNGVPGLTGAYAGAIVSLYGSNLAAGHATPTIVIGGQAATVLYSSPSQVNLQIPRGLAQGPALLTLNNGVSSAFPVTVNIDPAPAGITAVQDSSGAYVGFAHPAHPGDLLIVSLTNFAAPGANISPSRVQASLGGVSHNAIQILDAGSIYQVSFVLNPEEAAGQAQLLIVYLDGRSSLPAGVPVAANGSSNPVTGDSRKN